MGQVSASECVHVPVPVPGDAYRGSVVELVSRLAGGRQCGDPIDLPGGVVVSVAGPDVGQLHLARSVLGVLEPGRVVLLWRVQLFDVALSLASPGVQIAQRSYRVVYSGGEAGWSVDTEDQVSAGAQVVEGRAGVVDAVKSRSFGVSLGFDGTVEGGQAVGVARWSDRAAIPGGTSGVECEAALRVVSGRRSLVCEYELTDVSAGLVFAGIRLRGVQAGRSVYRYLVTLEVEA